MGLRVKHSQVQILALALSTYVAMGHIYFCINNSFTIINVSFPGWEPSLLYKEIFNATKSR